MEHDGDPIAAFELGRLPRITFGAGSHVRLGAIAARHGTRALLVTGGRSLAGSPHRAAIDDSLVTASVAMVGEVAVSGEPSPAIIEEALDRFRGAGVDVVIAVGGGSVLDTGKALGGLLESGTDLLDHLEGVGRGLPYPGPALPMVAVPTTAGTGSEATRNAVFSERGTGGYKRSFRDERLVPVEAVVDPDLLVGAPPDLIAANGLDALTQLLEAYTSTGSTPITDALARAGLESAAAGLLAWHAAPDGPDTAAARSHMAYAALLSGICLANAGLGAVHGLASPLGARLPIPHGMACGSVLHQTTARNLAALEARRPDHAARARYAEAGRLLADAPAADDEEALELLLDTLRAWVARLAVPGLGTFGLSEADIPAIVADARGSSMRTNPVELTDAELAAILEAGL